MEIVQKSTSLFNEWVDTKPWRLLTKPTPSLFDSLFPKTHVLLKVFASLVMVGVLIASGRLTFYLPDNPVPITFQTTAVLLTGGLFGGRWGLFTIILYYLLGMTGLGVFKDGSGGFTYATQSMTTGYLLGFVLATPLVGFLSRRGWNKSKIIWPMLLGNLIIYLPGLLWLYVNHEPNGIGFSWPKGGELFSKGMYPFIPGDLVKLMLASIFIAGSWTIVERKKKQ